MCSVCVSDNNRVDTKCDRIRSEFGAPVSRRTQSSLTSRAWPVLDLRGFWEVRLLLHFNFGHFNSVCLVWTVSSLASVSAVRLLASLLAMLLDRHASSGSSRAAASWKLPVTKSFTGFYLSRTELQSKTCMTRKQIKRSLNYRQPSVFVLVVGRPEIFGTNLM